MSLPASAPPVRTAASTPSPSTIRVLPIVGAIFGLPVVFIADAAVGLTGGPMFLLWAMAAVTPLAVYGIARLSRLPSGGPRAMLCLVALAGLLTGEIIAANAITGDDGQRCVLLSTKVVVARSQCAGRGGVGRGGSGQPADRVVLRRHRDQRRRHRPGRVALRAGHQRTRRGRRGRGQRGRFRR
jgi:hypothetical protein